MQYAVVAPWAARSTYRFLTASGSDDQRRDLLGFAVLPVLLLRLLYSQVWISVSRHQTARSKHRIVSKSLDFEQVDRKRSWDDQILPTALLFYVVNAAVPAAQGLPWWDSKGLVVAALLHGCGDVVVLARVDDAAEVDNEEVDDGVGGRELAAQPGDEAVALVHEPAGGLCRGGDDGGGVGHRRASLTTGGPRS